MSNLRCVEGKLPPGFRFHPRDHELICDYLMKWVAGCSHQSPLLIEVDLNKCEPWDIPETACVGGKEWYFYSQRDRKYATGLRTNRATVSGYWKATGKDRSILRNGTLVGMRKTLVFYQGRAPKGRKTEWVMHEFRLEGNTGSGTKTVVKEDWVICRVFYKNRSSEMLTSKQETSDVICSQSLPPLMEPYITFDKTQYQASNHAQFHEQVPCFSIYNQNQTSPNFSLLNHTEIFPNSMTKIMANNFESLLPDLGIYNNLQSLNMQSSCDEKVFKAVLNHLTKPGVGNHDLVFNHSMKGSSSFGEGSSDGYLSEVGFSSMWNQYS